MSYLNRTPIADTCILLAAISFWKKGNRGKSDRGTSSLNEL